MANDFYAQAAISRANMIEAEMAAAKADLMAHRANNDVESASASVQTIANLEAERANLNTLYQNYVQSQQPPAPEQLTDSERFARPWTKMTWQDGLDLAKTSRYVGEKGLSWDDPNVRGGYAEAMRRKSEGR
jgi:hypothetical protein